jgi:hypothetical protein
MEKLVATMQWSRWRVALKTSILTGICISQEKINPGTELFAPYTDRGPALELDFENNCIPVPCYPYYICMARDGSFGYIAWKLWASAR